MGSCSDLFNLLRQAVGGRCKEYGGYATTDEEEIASRDAIIQRADQPAGRILAPDSHPDSNPYNWAHWQKPRTGMTDEELERTQVYAKQYLDNYRQAYGGAFGF